MAAAVHISSKVSSLFDIISKAYLSVESWRYNTKPWRSNDNISPWWNVTLREVSKMRNRQILAFEYLIGKQFVGHNFSSITYLKYFVTFNRRNIFTRISDKKRQKSHCEFIFD